MAVELVGGALLSGFINVFFERLAPQDVILKHFGGNKDIVKMLDELKVKLLSAGALLDDAEEKQLTNPMVKNWLVELTHVLYRADFLIDKIDTEASQRQRGDESATIKSGILKAFSIFETSVIAEGQEILKRLDDLLGQTIFLGLKERPNRPLRRLTAPFVGKESDVVGRDGDKEEIIELLLSDDAGGNNLSVIPIVGLGGVGKTTLAQLVYNNSRVREHFDLKLWVTVSEDFDVSRITKIIYEEVTAKECKNRELFELQSKLNMALVGKRFLFVLDDVWNEKYEFWDGLKSAFESGARGSKIIVTTRSKEVALTMSAGVMHQLKLVSDQDCWGIFERHVFEDSAKAPAELQKIGREIVKRCKGLPLAVKSLAGLLRSTSKPEEWRKILNSDIWQLQFQKDLKKQVVPAVWLSYQFLPPYLKRCFAYLSIFPKDYEFGHSDKKTIIRLWMAEGLLEAAKGKKAEEVGEEYLQALIGRSFFQYSSQDESKLIMHDIVHDLAMFISDEFCFEFNDSNDLSKLPTKACYLSLMSSKASEVVEIMKGLTSQTRSLRTFLLLSLPCSRPFLQKSLLHDLFLKVGGCLRVLSLSQSLIKELPDSIENMKYLRYLDLSGNSIKELPDSICTLYNLQTLLLSRCENLQRLPTGLAALVNLRHLDITDTYHIKEMPQQMYKMKSLETLSYFVLGVNDGWRIKELGELPLLGGSLCISGLEYIVDVKDVLEANLKDKEFLSQLILKWNRSSQQEIEVLEALQPHTNLKQLTIEGYRGTIFPNWVGHESFCHMVQVNLLSCRNVRTLPPLGQLSSLRSVEIKGLYGVVSIGNEFCGSSSTTTNHQFKSLEELEIELMFSLQEWSFSSDRLGQEGGVFPSLTKLCITDCGKLIVGLPDCHLPSLKSIDFWKCDELVGVFVCQSRREMDTNAFPSLQSNEIITCKKLKGLNDRGFQHLTSLQILKIRNCRALECLPQEGLPRSLSCLTIVGCSEVLKQRCQREIGEDWPKIKHIPKIEIDCSEYDIIQDPVTGQTFNTGHSTFCTTLFVGVSSYVTSCFTKKLLILLAPFSESFKIESKRSLVCYQVTNIFEQELQDHQRPSLLRKIASLDMNGWLLKGNYKENGSPTSQTSTIYHSLLQTLIDEKRNPNDLTIVKLEPSPVRLLHFSISKLP